MTAYPTVTQNAFLADEIGQQILRAGKDYQTIPYPEFYALVETHTGKTKFNENDLKQAFLPMFGAMAAATSASMTLRLAGS